jgi:hypothetical protein
VQGNGQTPGNSSDNASAKKSNLPSTSSTNSLPDAQGLVSGARATDSARIAKFTNELSRPAVISGKTFVMVYNMELSTSLQQYSCIKHSQLSTRLSKVLLTSAAYPLLCRQVA